MGVWIETMISDLMGSLGSVTPCMGVWIETPFRLLAYHKIAKSPPVWVCGLKLIDIGELSEFVESHPVWVCGLKL